MSDESATSYTADGPGTFGFRTGGVVAPSSDSNVTIGADLKGFDTGVRGTGRAVGVHGFGGNTAGVFGEGLQSGGRGVVGHGTRHAEGIFGVSTSTMDDEKRKVASNVGILGISDGGKGTGIHGISASFVGVSGIFESIPADGSGTGILGESGSGTGVSGTCSGSGTGVKGNSERGRGGVFSSGAKAQIQLAPVDDKNRKRPPKEARAGDLFVIMVDRPTAADEEKIREAELWFCLQSSTGSVIGITKNAKWGRVQFDKFQQ